MESVLVSHPPPPIPFRPPPQNPKSATVVTKFHALRPPVISIRQYLERINKYAGCSPECFVLALVYIDLLIARNGLALTSFNIHRIIITAVMLAAKFFDDQYYNNAYYARVGGLPCSEVNALELEMLFSCGFSLHVSTDDFQKYFTELAGHCLAPPGSERAAKCDCASYSPCLGFAPEELLYTGLRKDLVEAATAAAFNYAATGAAGSGSVMSGGGGFDSLPIVTPTPSVLAAGGAPVSLLGGGTTSGATISAATGGSGMAAMSSSSRMIK